MSHKNTLKPIMNQKISIYYAWKFDEIWYRNTIDLTIIDLFVLMHPFIWWLIRLQTEIRILKKGNTFFFHFLQGMLYAILTRLKVCKWIIFRHFFTKKDRLVWDSFILKVRVEDLHEFKITSCKHWEIWWLWILFSLSRRSFFFKETR